VIIRRSYRVVASATLAAFAVCVAAPVEAEPVSLPAASVERDGFPYPVSEIIVRYDNEVGPTGLSPVRWRKA
jgi:hypothetical protein